MSRNKLVDPAEFDFALLKEPKRVQVFPLFGKPHVRSEKCWCGPQYDSIKPNLLIHNASE